MEPNITKTLQLNDIVITNAKTATKAVEHLLDSMVEMCDHLNEITSSRKLTDAENKAGLLMIEQLEKFEELIEEHF